MVGDSSVIDFGKSFIFTIPLQAIIFENSLEALGFNVFLTFELIPSQPIINDPSTFLSLLKVTVTKLFFSSYPLSS